MTEDEVAEFLTRWLLEVGLEPVVWLERESRHSCRWYGQQCISVHDRALKRFFDIEKSSSPIRINQAGLDFIKNYERK